MARLAFHMDVFGCIGLTEEVRAASVVRRERDTVLASKVSSAEFRVLALLPAEIGSDDLARLGPTTCSSSADLEKHLARGGFDVVVVDTDLADGWPVDVATKIANRADRSFALLLLFEHDNDRLVAETRLNGQDARCFTKSALEPGRLTTIITSLATLH